VFVQVQKRLAITAVPSASFLFGPWQISRSGADGGGGSTRFRRASRARPTRKIVLTGVDLTSYGALICRGMPKLGILTKQILRHVA